MKQSTEQAVQQALSGLLDIRVMGREHDFLTEDERELLAGIEYRLRGRLGEIVPKVDDLFDLGTDIIVRRAAQIGAEAKQGGA